MLSYVDGEVSVLLDAQWRMTGAMSINQRAVTPCGWGVKAGRVGVSVTGKTV